MTNQIDRRQFAKLMGLGGAAFATGLFTQTAGGRAWAATQAKEFYFVQLSDTHWGFQGPKVNPDPTHPLPMAIEAVNAMNPAPDFVVFTGDLTHTTDDADERRRRMTGFRDQVKALKIKDVHFLAGEHDASLDNGAAFKEFFGDTHYTFDHNGIHFIALDNVSDPSGALGDAQLDWLKTDLANQAKGQPIVVFTHRPLFDLYPQWDWATRDGAKAIDLLTPYEHVTVFYGHIHQVNSHMTGKIAHHAAESLIFPQPAPGSTPTRTPVLWDPDAPFKGLGWRSVEADPAKAVETYADHPLKA
jgi:3',5'-cyclic AMP phosphodiesterase CpdA